ncbi:hypothetical protein Z968_09315 [Clostridium novyi A str. 4552]|uniref:Uncharacterized protein n=1 Tax=Clostridium novyi A str. 4552 TaxID=1444289 RepID=A0A0A0I6N8_CLONO|nr:hypothetical protein [Clostridium novyi]KGM95315.1 hypothetical protein Z968_09315 [Clostridium novyi A str. 4552]
MRMFMLSLPQEFVTPIISATSVIIGSVIGGICTWITAKHSIRKSTEVENKIVEENRKYDEVKILESFRQNVNIIRLDISNAVFQSIRNIKKIEEKNYINKYPIPLNKEYSKVISCLNKKFTLKELSYIYQLYAIIEILNNHIGEIDITIKDNLKYNLIKEDCELVLKKIYGEKYKEVFNWNIDNMTYEEIYNNTVIKEGYKKVLKKLDDIASL